MKDRIKKCFIHLNMIIMLISIVSMLYWKNIICFSGFTTILLYKYSRECDGIVRRNQAEESGNVAYVVNRPTTSINLLAYNMILIISASPSIVLIWTAATSHNTCYPIHSICIALPILKISYTVGFFHCVSSMNVKFL